MHIHTLFAKFNLVLQSKENMHSSQIEIAVRRADQRYTGYADSEQSK